MSNGLMKYRVHDDQSGLDFEIVAYNVLTKRDLDVAVKTITTLFFSKQLLKQMGIKRVTVFDRDNVDIVYTLFP